MDHLVILPSSLQDLHLGEFCCIDIMGATQFKTSRPNWDKKCCSNQRGPFVEVPEGLEQKKMTQLDAQIGRMPELKEVMQCCGGR